MEKDNHSEVRQVASNRTVRCPSCESINVRKRIEDASFVYGVGERAVELAVQIPVHSCRACGLEFTDSEAEEIRHQAICGHQGIMTPREVVAIRKAHGLSRSEFAELTRLGEASLARWENGTLLQNKAYDSFLYLLKFPENMERLRRNTQGPAFVDERQQSKSFYPQFRLLQRDEERENAAKEFELRPTGS